MKKKKKIIDKLTIPNNVNLSKIESNSWFDISKYDYNNALFVKPKKNKKDDDKTTTRCKTIELFLNKKHKIILKDWFEIYKYSYNQTIKYINKYKPNINFQYLRPKVKNLFSDEMKLLIKNSKIPAHTIDESIRDVVTAYKSAFTNLAEGNIKHFRIRYKKDKSARVALKLEGTSFPNGNLPADKNNYCLDSLFDPKYKFKYNSGNTFCPSVFGRNLTTSESIEGIERTSILLWNKRTNRYFLKTPIDKDILTKEAIDNRDICAIDPGIRTFMTIYGTKSIYQIGTNCQKMINKEQARIKTLNDKIKLKDSKKEIYKMKKRVNIIQQKIENRVDDMHFKTVKLLNQNYRTILLGKLSTKGICSKLNSLNATTKKVCYALKHDSFRNKLSDCGKIFNSNVEFVSEHYTSKTCCSCRRRNESYSNETFKCSFCNYKMNRDIMGAYNIFYKHFDMVKSNLKVI